MTSNAKRLETGMARLAKLVIGCIAIGVLMAVREEFESSGMRALIAAIAGAILGLLILPMSRRAR